MLKNEPLVLSENSFITGDRSGPGKYTTEELKAFDPLTDGFYRDRLVECLEHHQEGYYKGLTGVVDEDIAGSGAFQLQLDIAGPGDDEHLTFANVFINSNYPRFINESLPCLSRRPVVLVCNEAANLGNFPCPILKEFRIGNNCYKDDYDLIGKMVNWVNDNQIEDTTFLFCASTLSNYLIYRLSLHYPNNTYLDIGSALAPWMGLDGWRYSRAYLQHHVLGLPNKYGTQEDTWN